MVSVLKETAIERRSKGDECLEGDSYRPFPLPRLDPQTSTYGALKKHLIRII